jgi:hypothetical protein
VCVCMYVYIYIYIYIYIYMYCVLFYVCIYVCMYGCMDVRGICMYVKMTMARDIFCAQPVTFDFGFGQQCYESNKPGFNFLRCLESVSVALGDCTCTYF